MLPTTAPATIGVEALPSLGGDGIVVGSPGTESPGKTPLDPEFPGMTVPCDVKMVELLEA